jgi:nitroreductase
MADSNNANTTDTKTTAITINEIIRRRRSIKPKQMAGTDVEESIIHDMLENANWAPTHGMTEPWRFKVFTGESRAKLGAFLASTYKKITSSDEFKEKKFESLRINPTLAPYVIAICMKRQTTEKIPVIEEIEAVACAVQNMHLTATAYGLGAFWSSNAAVCSKAMVKYVGLGNLDQVLGLFYVGYPSIDWPTGERQPIDEKVEWIS